ncbi:hypothetical protein PIB30_073442 [Stylosanthes scabra]|uniref:Mitochondrial pyruvate carrier n=1 Tax=Stylosanthes scabra TaxID=79078 RepID=A0ABU6WMP2_9FABA|nr:hypothetical protein [Stylosanthes scabra]
MNTLRTFWNSPIGPKTTHFWGPTFNWSLPLAAKKELKGAAGKVVNGGGQWWRSDNVSKTKSSNRTLTYFYRGNDDEQRPLIIGDREMIGQYRAIEQSGDSEAMVF